MHTLLESKDIRAAIFTCGVYLTRYKEYDPPDFIKTIQDEKKQLLYILYQEWMGVPIKDIQSIVIEYTIDPIEIINNIKDKLVVNIVEQKNTIEGDGRLPMLSYDDTNDAHRDMVCDLFLHPVTRQEFQHAGFTCIISQTHTLSWSGSIQIPYSHQGYDEYQLEDRSLHLLYQRYYLSHFGTTDSYAKWSLYVPRNDHDISLRRMIKDPTNIRPYRETATYKGYDFVEMSLRQIAEELQEKYEIYSHTCYACNKTVVQYLRCSRCKKYFYCSKECQMKTARYHKSLCDKYYAILQGNNNNNNNSIIHSSFIHNL